MKNITLETIEYNLPSYNDLPKKFLEFIEANIGRESYIFLHNYYHSFLLARLELANLSYINYHNILLGKISLNTKDTEIKTKLLSFLQIDILSKCMMAIEDFSAIGLAALDDIKNLPCYLTTIGDGFKIFNDLNLKNSDQLRELFGFPLGKTICKNKNDEFAYDEILNKNIDVFAKAIDEAKKFKEKMYEFYLCFKHKYFRLFTAFSLRLGEDNRTKSSLLFDTIMSAHGGLDQTHTQNKFWVADEIEIKQCLQMLDNVLRLTDRIVHGLMTKIDYLDMDFPPEFILTEIDIDKEVIITYKRFYQEYLNSKTPFKIGNFDILPAVPMKSLDNFIFHETSYPPISNFLKKLPKSKKSHNRKNLKTRQLIKNLLSS